MTVFYAGDGSNNVYPWKKQAEVVATIVSVDGGEGGLQHKQLFQTKSPRSKCSKNMKVQGSCLRHPRIQCILGLHEQQQPKINLNKILFSKYICFYNLF